MLNEHDAFLLSIGNDLTNPAPKFAYADWLEEQGDPACGAWRWLAIRGKYPDVEVLSRKSWHVWYHAFAPIHHRIPQSLWLEYCRVRANAVNPHISLDVVLRDTVTAWLGIPKIKTRLSRQGRRCDCKKGWLCPWDNLCSQAASEENPALMWEEVGDSDRKYCTVEDLEAMGFICIP
jgi:uncharacterized protein (TIGR02996 family)